MQILAHRGLWRTDEEKNTRQSLQRAFKAGFGTETDIRDLDGELVVSHDMPRKGGLTLATMLDDYVKAGSPGTLALNIKSDGLSTSLQYLLNYYEIADFFCFDMSVPDALSYRDHHLPFAARLSEYEPEGLLSEQAAFLWWDMFDGDLPSVERLYDWLAQGKRVCIVSPELHGKPYKPYWEQLRTMPTSIRQHTSLQLCTDHPDYAGEFFS